MKNYKETKNIHSEEEVIKLLVDELNLQNFKLVKEVPNMGQSVDLVAERDNQLTFIEGKISDWKRALIQCKAHELVADYIYIAIASVTVSESFLKEARNSGYGIIHCDPYTGTLNWVLRAKLNPKVWLPQREVFFSSLREIEYEY
jgi:hypothetical protein